MDCLFLSKTPLFKDMTAEEIKESLEFMNGYEKRFTKSEIILHAGDKTDSLCLVLSGSVNIKMNNSRGDSNIIGFVGQGQLFAEAYSVVRQKSLLCDAEAAADTTVLFLQTDKLLSADRYPGSFCIKLIKNMLMISAEKNLALSSRMTHTAPRLIRDRLVSYLSEQSAAASCKTFKIPFSRQQLADYLSVERSALSNELSKMKRDGLIDYNKNNFCLYF